MSATPPRSPIKLLTMSEFYRRFPGARILPHHLVDPWDPSAEDIERLEPLDEHPGAHLLAHGDAADIWVVETPTDESPSVRVVHKVLRVDRMSDHMGVHGPEYHKKLWRDFLEISRCDYHAKVEQWKLLEHENVVRVLGLGDKLNLKVEMCERGTVREFLETKPQHSQIKLDIMAQVLEGVQYLHTHNPPVVHGSLNAGKLFIDGKGTIKIGEFGLTALCEPFGDFVHSVSFADSFRWLSPELLASEIEPRTTASDIWALGCVLLEIVTETIPYSNSDYKDEIALRDSILSGNLPAQHEACTENQLFNSIWPLLMDCWQFDPGNRPSVSSLLERARPTIFQHS